MSVISRVIDTITPDFGQNFDLLRQGGEALVDALEEAGNETRTYSLGLAEVYATRMETDLLASGVSTLVNRSNPLAGVNFALASSDQNPDTIYDGVYVGANGQTFPPATPLDQVPAVRPSDGREPNETLIYINGINTPKEGQEASLQAIADRTGAQVIGIHNATEGMISDLGQCIADKLDKGRNPAVDTLADTIYTPSAKSESRMKGITRDEAVRMIQAYFKSYGIDSPGLNENNLGGASLGEYQVYFEYQPANQALKCSALIYKFHDEPKPGVIESFKSEEREKRADTGGGTLEYETQNKGLYLSRIYTDTVSDEAFARDLKRLMKAAEVYGDQVLDSVASKVFTQNN